jgi:thiamine biosynthesis lipoprotein
MPATDIGTQSSSVESVTRFPCFGGEVVIFASGHPEEVALALRAARSVAEEAHDRLSRFAADSELSRLNADPRGVVPASDLLCRLAAAVRWAGDASRGLVDGTCLDAVEASGYRGDFVPGAEMLDWMPSGEASDRAPLPGAWRSVSSSGGAVVRPRGVRLDSGGLAKGLVADEIATLLRACDDWAIDCGGDLRVGGRLPRQRLIEIRDPIDAAGVVHRLTLRSGAVATSGTTRRRWRGGHHLIDPRTGQPADTGVIQATALAPTGLEAEVRAKAALLAGPRDGWRELHHGGVLVMADGSVQVREG